MKRTLVLLLLLSAQLLLGAEDDPASVQLVSRGSELQIDGRQWVGLYFEIENGWHIYSEHPDQKLMMPRVEWDLPEGIELGEISWPEAISFSAAGLDSVGYEDEVLLPIPIRATQELTGVDSVTLKATIQWVACKDICIPYSKNVQLELPLTLNSPNLDPRWAAAFDDQVSGLELAEAEIGGFGWALLFALLGGLILNLMPCVLPVISLKVMSFVNMAGKGKRHVLDHGLFFTLGVLISFWILAGALIVLQSWGEAVGWGFQLQDPRFVGLLAVVLFVLGLSMLGVFEFGLLLSSKAGQMESGRKGLAGAFWSGVLATAVATPCTGPFLGPVLGYAITIPPLKGLTIFTAMGLGMSLPYLLLSAFPRAVNYLPKPGAWMITFKEIMGFLMLASVIWLVWVFGAQTSNAAVLALLLGLLSIAIGCWIYGKWGRPLKKTVWRFSTYLWISVFVGMGLQLIVGAAKPYATGRDPIELQAAKDSRWEPYSRDRVDKLRAAGTPVFIDFTAKWCVLCQVNKAVFLNKEVMRRFDEQGVVLMRADWTKFDEQITWALQRFGRNGVPFNVLYGTEFNQKPWILKQPLSVADVLKHLDKLEQQIQEQG